MGKAADNRGSRAIAQQADVQILAADVRADCHALEDENECLRKRLAVLEIDLARARRCLVAERLGRESLRVRLLKEESEYAFSVGILCRIVFT